MKLTTTNFRQLHRYMGLDGYRQYVGESGELLLVDIFETLGVTFVHTPNDNEVLDFYLPGLAIEVKTMAYMKHHGVVISKVDRARKKEHCIDLELMGFTVAVSLVKERTNKDKKLEHDVKIWYKPGFKRFRVAHMLPFEDLLWEILEMQGLVEARPEDGMEHEG